VQLKPAKAFSRTAEPRSSKTFVCEAYLEVGESGIRKPLSCSVKPS